MLHNKEVILGEHNDNRNLYFNEISGMWKIEPVTCHTPLSNWINWYSERRLIPKQRQQRGRYRGRWSTWRRKVGKLNSQTFRKDREFSYVSFFCEIFITPLTRSLVMEKKWPSDGEKAAQWHLCPFLLDIPYLHFAVIIITSWASPCQCFDPISAPFQLTSNRK